MQPTHRYVSANGARFHIAEVGAAAHNEERPLIVLLHGFPQFWWSWRAQLPALAEAGFHAVAMDLRGYGGSDKTPRGYDARTLAADVAGVIRSLGSRDAIVVGQGWGGYVGWTLAASDPKCVRALVAVSAPHPLAMFRSLLSRPARPLLGHLITMQVPWLPERRIMRGSYVKRHLTRWSSPGSTFPTQAEADRYRAELANWPSPHCALEYHRWLFRSRVRADGREFTRILRRGVNCPVLEVRGAADPAVRRELPPPRRARVIGARTTVVMPGVGHFAPEEDAEEFTGVLLRWLAGQA